MTQARLTHLDMAGHARMVDVSAKPATHRKAVACGEILMASRTLDMIQSGDMPKGDVRDSAYSGDHGGQENRRSYPIMSPSEPKQHQRGFCCWE